MRKYYLLALLFMMTSAFLTTSFAQATSSEFRYKVVLEKGQTSLSKPFHLMKTEDIIVTACNHIESAGDIEYTLYRLNQGQRFLVGRFSLERGTAYGYRLPKSPPGTYLFEITSQGTCKADGGVLVIDPKESVHIDCQKKPAPPAPMECCNIL